MTKRQLISFLLIVGGFAGVFTWAMLNPYDPIPAEPVVIPASDTTALDQFLQSRPKLKRLPEEERKAQHRRAMEARQHQQEILQQMIDGKEPDYTPQ
jgi:hypothetical protein